VHAVELVGAHLVRVRVRVGVGVRVRVMVRVRVGVRVRVELVGAHEGEQAQRAREHGCREPQLLVQHREPRRSARRA